MDQKDMIAQLAASYGITAEEAERRLKESQPPKGKLYCKVSAKGALSVYGLQRMPVTLYIEQWQRLLDFTEELRAYMKEHDAELKRKAR